MKTSATWNRVVYVFTLGVVTFFIAMALFAQPSPTFELKVMKTGLGSGTITSDASNPGINCGADCDESYDSSAMVTLTPTGAGFSRWSGDCSGTGACVVPMTAARSVRVEFSLTTTIPEITDFTPEGIRDYLIANPTVNSAARFIKALPPAYKQNWLLMSRSESLQTGVADSPRILLPSADARAVFTVGMTTHSSYPGSHPNAIEYMQWDNAQKNFRFHEVVLDTVPAVPKRNPDGTVINPPTDIFPERLRGVSIDDAKCSKCHSTRNVLNRSSFPGTTGIPAGISPNEVVQSKNKPNWDTYDSWGGMLPFNRDRIYQGSVEAAAFRKLFNLWTWRTNDPVRSIIEQLELQPPGIPAEDTITRTNGGAYDGHINFYFDNNSVSPPSPPILTEPTPSVSASPRVTYSFDRGAGPAPGTPVMQGGAFVRLHHSATPTSDEGRGVQLFDLVGGGDGSLNQQRIADELAGHRYVTGSVPLDARPIALAIAKGCLTRSNAATALSSGVGFFAARHGGLTLDQVVADTRQRAQSMPRRKADIQRLNLDRRNPDGSVDEYFDLTVTPLLGLGLIQKYNDGTAWPPGTSTSLERMRQEVFRRPTAGFPADATVMGGVYIDREDYSTATNPFNTERVALYRYFLEPLGVSVDKWSMGVRGRSRTYSFADVFDDFTYVNTLITGLEASLGNPMDPFPGLAAPAPAAGYSCTDLLAAVNSSFAALPPPDAVPTYTDVQRIFNKSCIECHGDLRYPPFNRYFAVNFLDLSENEDPAAGSRLARSHGLATTFTTTDPATSRIYDLITRDNEGPVNPTGMIPGGMMPYGGPKLSPVDTETIRRWIVGGRPNTAGDPHLKTIDGTNYDFQSAGEFVMLRGENFEIQTRQTAVATETPMAPNPHTGLSSCASINSAVALRVGPHRITYQPNLSGQPDPNGLQLRVDGRLVERLDARGVPLTSGGRILPTTGPGGIQIEFPGGTDIVVTPGWWEYYQVWYLNIDVRHARATEGVMGTIAPGNWLPALPDGTLLGARPTALPQRYQDLYVKFADAWRVNDRSSLFDYASGTSTSTFTFAAWPGQAPNSCQLPKDLEGPPGKPPLKPLPPETAKQHCQALVEADRRANCEQDVMVTGEPGFAKTYLLTEQIQRNAPPTAPALLFPEDDKIDLGGTIDFAWQKTADAEGDGLTYRHCIWRTEATPTFNQCQELPKQTGLLEGRKRYLLWALLVICLLLIIILYARARISRPLLALLTLAILAAAVFALLSSRSNNLSRTVAALESGQSYYWKVVVEDGKGGTTESKTRRFVVK